MLKSPSKKLRPRGPEKSGKKPSAVFRLIFSRNLKNRIQREKLLNKSRRIVSNGRNRNGSNDTYRPKLVVFGVFSAAVRTDSDYFSIEVSKIIVKGKRLKKNQRKSYQMDRSNG